MPQRLRHDQIARMLRSRYGFGWLIQLITSQPCCDLFLLVLVAFFPFVVDSGIQGDKKVNRFLASAIFGITTVSPVKGEFLILLRLPRAGEKGSRKSSPIFVTYPFSFLMTFFWTVWVAAEAGYLYQRFCHSFSTFWLQTSGLGSSMYSFIIRPIIGMNGTALWMQPKHKPLPLYIYCVIMPICLRNGPVMIDKPVRFMLYYYEVIMD